MALTIDMRVAELLTSRLCHDLAGPIAAIGNGAELLDDDDPDFARQAATLIGESAGTAAKRLQLFRFVYGFSAGAMAGPPPHQLVSEYFAGSAVACDYPETARQLEAAWQRLGCSLLIIAGEALPRGGAVTLLAEGAAVAIAARGEGPGPSAETVNALNLRISTDALTSRNVGAYFAALLAQALGRRLRVATELGGFRIFCETGGAEPAHSVA
jgi:histidine phosphotransferase ChpT